MGRPANQPTSSRGPLAILVATVVAALGLAGCGVDGSSSSATSTTSTTSTTVPADRSEQIVVAVETDQVAVTLEVPEGWEVVLDGSGGISDHDRRDGCAQAVRARIRPPNVYSAIAVEAVPASCEPSNSRPGNGNHGTYRTMDDVPEAEAITQVETAAGPASRFEQPYYECTSECSSFTDTVAIVELDEPVDPDYPTVVVRAEETEIGAEAFDRILASLDTL
jgi:hypothetical protein